MNDPDVSEDKKNDTGSSESDEPVFLAVAKLGAPHGVHGEVNLLILTDFPERIAPGTAFFLGPERRPVTIRSVKIGGKKNILGLAGILTREQASRLRGQVLFVRTEDLPPLPEGEYYHHQLLGLRVRTDEGRELGFVAEILTTGANDVYVVRSDPGLQRAKKPQEVLIPASDEVVQRVDLKNRILTVHLLPGLLSD